MKSILVALLLVLASARSVAAQPYTLGYFATTTGTSAVSPLAGSTQVTLTVAPTTLTAGAAVLLDRAGANPELLTVATVSGAVFTMTTGTVFVHLAPFTVDWPTTPTVPIATLTIPTATCGALPPVGVTVNINPTVVAWNDDACVAPQVYASNQPAWFASIPVGNWWAAVSNTLNPGWSNPSPFGRARQVPTNFRVIR
jgi:hypothetical protein